MYVCIRVFAVDYTCICMYLQTPLHAYTNIHNIKININIFIAVFIPYLQSHEHIRIHMLWRLSKSLNDSAIHGLRSPVQFIEICLINHITARSDNAFVPNRFNWLFERELTSFIAKQNTGVICKPILKSD